MYIEDESSSSEETTESIHEIKAMEPIEAKLTDSEHFRKELTDIINTLCTDEEYLQSEIHNIIDNIIKDSDEDIQKDKSLPSGDQLTDIDLDEKVDDLLDDKTEIAEENVPIDTDQPTEVEAPNENDLIVDQNVVESGPELGESNEENEIKEVDDNGGLNKMPSKEGNLDLNRQNDSDSNVSDWSKKVTFSSTEMVKEKHLLSEISIKATLQERENALNESQLSLGHDNNKRSVIFGPPNPNLLSDADEVWPDALAQDALKPSSSVTQSISSLGKLSEVDEKYTTPSQADHISIAEENIKLQDKNVTKIRDEATVGIDDENKSSPKIESNVTTESKETENQITPADVITAEEKTPDAGAGIQESDKISEVPKEKIKTEETLPIDIAENQYIHSLLSILQSHEKPLLTGEELEQAELVSIEKTLELHDLSKIKTDKQRKTTKEKELETAQDFVTLELRPADEGFDENVRIPPQKETQKIRDWKVELQGAPSWITQVNAHGEPSEDSMLLAEQGKPIELTSSHIRKWCEDLDVGFKNLEIWRDWLRKTSNEIDCLFRKNRTCKCPKQKYSKKWVKLQQNITADADFLRRINMRTHKKFEVFQQYRSFKIASSKHTSKCACKTRIN
ncbi:uncharacterized protein LOC142975814 [Anticarsia gemmatalis]|uniref:uncharacterized protein LOC142975814 n=1 Tax=Anticarsia gemmatalis TaxID=129554 RepID=UPI003F75C47F